MWFSAMITKKSTNSKNPADYKALLPPPAKITSLLDASAFNDQIEC